MKKLLTFFAAVLAILASCSEKDNSLTVACHNGKMVGYTEGNLAIFKGVPFAVPPTGDLRWKEPVEAPESDAEILCRNFGHVAIQAQDLTGSEPAASSNDKDEDCLTLNIWTQNFDPSAKKAVMFYIHGGAFALGGTVDPMYDGQFLAASDPDIIVVTTNYRVGILGFLPMDNVPGYSDEYKNSGILGILDQQMALKWVKRNISQFGGDPDNVTIFGESAGGGSVACHLVMPGSKGLFKRAIMMSGDCSLTSSRITAVNQEDDGKALNMAKRLMEATGKSDFAGLKELTKEELMDANESIVPYSGSLPGDNLATLISAPIFEEGPDAVLPEPFEALKNGAGEGIDLMVGTTFDEMNYFTFLNTNLDVTTAPYRDKYADKPFGYWRAYCDYAFEHIGVNSRGVKEAFKEYLEKCPSDRDTDEFLYEPDPLMWRKTDLLSEMMFRQGSICTADLHSKNGNNTYMYYFGVPHYQYAVQSDCPWVGSCHASDVIYAFNNPTHPSANPELKSLCEAWSHAFIQFAKTGNPGWDKYDSQDRKTMVVSPDGKMEVVSNPRKERTDILQPVFLEYFRSRTVVTTPNFHLDK